MNGTREQQATDYFDVMRELAGNQPFIRHLAATLPRDRPVARQLAEMPLDTVMRLYCRWVEQTYGEGGAGVQPDSASSASPGRFAPSQVWAVLRRWLFPAL